MSDATTTKVPTEDVVKQTPEKSPAKSGDAEIDFRKLLTIPEKIGWREPASCRIM